MTSRTKAVLSNFAICAVGALCGAVILWLPPWWKTVYQFCLTTIFVSYAGWLILRLRKLIRQMQANLDATRRLLVTLNQHIEDQKPEKPRIQ